MSESSTPPSSAAGATPVTSAASSGTARLPVNWRVLIAAAVVIIGLSAWAIAAPEQADAVIGGVVAWVASRLGWFYAVSYTHLDVYKRQGSPGPAGSPCGGRRTPAP